MGSVEQRLLRLEKTFGPFRVEDAFTPEQMDMLFERLREEEPEHAAAVVAALTEPTYNGTRLIDFSHLSEGKVDAVRSLLRLMDEVEAPNA